TELLHGPLDPSNDAFGGGQWATQFRTIKSGYGILNVIGSAKLDTNAAKNTAAINSVRGYVHTIQALAFLMVLNSHTEDSIPIDVNHSLPSLAPLVTNDSAYRHVISLLDSARTALHAAGTAFPFDPGPSFADFNTPATFLKFNRGLAARAWAYRASPFKPGANCAACWDSAAAALGASFLAPAASLDLGAYISFGTGNQDTPDIRRPEADHRDRRPHGFGVHQRSPEAAPVLALVRGRAPLDRHAAVRPAVAGQAGPAHGLRGDQGHGVGQGVLHAADQQFRGPGAPVAAPAGYGVFDTRSVASPCSSVRGGIVVKRTSLLALVLV